MLLTTRKSVVLSISALLVLLLIITIAGCTNISDSNQEAQVPQELTVGVDADGYKTEGDKANLGAYPLNANIYEPLVRLTLDYRVEPLLATKWEYRGDNTWRFYLRKGVKFHDGQDFTAEAVKFTLDRVARTGGSFINIGENSVKMIDDYTVDITPTKPNMRLVEGLTHPSFGIKAPGSDPGKAPVGTGPFKFASYEKSVQLVVDRNPSYWGAPVKLEKITFKFIPDNATRIMALQAGEVDMITKVPRESVAQLKANTGMQVLTSLPGSYSAIYLSINGKKPYDLLNDRKLRLALALAIDRDSIVNNIWEGNAEVNQTVVPPNVLGSEKTKVKGFNFDPDKAAKLLEEAGWKKGPDGICIKDGQKLTLTLVSGFPSAERHKPLPEVLQSQLRDVGVNVKIVETSDTGIYEDMLTEGKGDMWLEAGSQNTADPTFLPELLFHSKGLYSMLFKAPFAPGGEFDRLIDEARLTPDPIEAVQLSADAMHVLIDDEVVVIPIASIYNIFAAKDRVQGFEPHPSWVNTSWTGIFIK